MHEKRSKRNLGSEIGDAMSDLLRTVLIDKIYLGGCSSASSPPIGVIVSIVRSPKLTKKQGTYLTVIDSGSVSLKASRDICTVPKLRAIFRQAQCRYTDLLDDEASGNVAGAGGKDGIIRTC